MRNKNPIPSPTLPLKEREYDPYVTLPLKEREYDPLPGPPLEGEGA